MTIVVECRCGTTYEADGAAILAGRWRQCPICNGPAPTDDPSMVPADDGRASGNSSPRHGHRGRRGVTDRRRPGATPAHRPRGAGTRAQ